MAENVELFNDVYKEMVDLVGYDNTIKLFAYFKGQQITFPIKLYKSEYIKKLLQKECDGKNIKTLAKKYGYSERWIKELIKKNGKNTF